MRDVVQELLTHLVDLFFILNILEQLIVRRFQFGDRLLKLFRHAVEVLSKLIDLIARLAVIFRIKIQFTHLGRKLCQFTDRLRDTLCDHPNHQTAESNDPDSHIEIKAVGNRNALADALKRSTDQEIASTLQLSPAFHVFHSGKTVTDLLDHIIVIFLENFLLALLLVKIIYVSNQPGLQHILIISNRADRLSV